MTTIERVARAIYGRVAPDFPWDSIPPGLQEAVFVTAREAIEAMRKVNSAVLGESRTYHGQNLVTRHQWEGIIDAILSETHEPPERNESPAV